MKTFRCAHVEPGDHLNSRSVAKTCFFFLSFRSLCMKLYEPSAKKMSLSPVFSKFQNKQKMKLFPQNADENYSF